ncbi:MAG: (Fe-S)-binding protein [Promethearchaeota archaeon]
MTSSKTPDLPASLDDYAKISRLCSLCSRMCRHSCPTHLVTGSDACSPIGRALIIELYRGHKSALTEAAVDRLYQCNLCGACKAWCKPRHELPQIIELARERVVEENRAPMGTLALDQNVSEYSNVYGEPHNKRFVLLKNALKDTTPNAKVAYFVGCTTAYRHPEIALATHRVFKALNIEYDFLSGSESEVCCGSPLIRAGFIKSAKSLATQNVAAIAKSNAQTVITTCPGCARALRNDYPRLGISLPKKVRVLHISEFLIQHQKKLAPLLTQLSAQNQTLLTYHDPCHLGRELGVYEQPRRLLHLIPGIQLKEFVHNRDKADCCGGGGALPKTFPSLSEEITHRRLDDASTLAVELLVSACPNCKLHFTDVHLKSTGDEFEILDLMELLVRALKAPTRGR